jgi:hypothetical protein
VTATSSPIRAVDALTGTDLLRLAALPSVLLGTLGWGLLGFALFLFVLGGTMVPRAIGVPAVTDAAYCLVLLLGAWAAVLDWYQRVGWLDLVMHAAAGGAIAVVAYLAMERLGTFPPGLPPSGVAVATASLGTTLTVVWEFAEWFGHTVVDDRIQVGYADTLGDVAAGVAGATGAGLLLATSMVGAGSRR